jgi:hypothetical protein
MRRSVWPRGVRQEMSSPAQTLGFGVPITLEALMSVHVYSVVVLSFVGRVLSTGSSHVQDVLQTVCKIRNSRPVLMEAGQWS